MVTHFLRTYKFLKELKMPPKTSEITELPKNFFVLIKNINWYNKSVQLRYKNNKLQVGCTDKDYNLPTLSFKRFKELTNPSRNLKWKLELYK